MNILSVIPLSRAKVARSLSYFTASEVPVGALITVPLRSKTIHGIVSETRSAQDLKTEIKNAPFEIRKLGKVKSVAFFPTSFMAGCQVLADYYATTPGAIIDTLVSDTILESAGKIPPPLPAQASFIERLPNQGEIHVIQGDDMDRISSWRSLIRSEFARKRSIALYVPTIEDAKNMFTALEKGIERHIFILHGNLPKKKIIDTWRDLADAEHPVIVIATGSFAVLPRSDIDTIIIERENSRGWISQKTPFLDLRHALEVIARKKRQTVYLADSLLQATTLHRVDEHEIIEGSPFKWRSISTAHDELLDMREYKASENKFRILSPELEELIRRNQEESTHLFIMAIRRGLSPTTVCDDCETIVTCKNCAAPVVLHTSPTSGKNFFMCHACGERRSADESCANCEGWRLTPLGIGIDRVQEEIKKKFPKIDILKIDADTTTSEKQIEDVMDKFRNRPGSLLLGTEKALLHLIDKVDHVAVASLDSLFALPDFRIQEKIMYTLIRLRSIANRSILVQTRRAEEKVFDYGLKGNLSDFYRATIDDRKQYQYPPFSVLIKITLEGKKEAIAKEMATIQSLVEPHEIDIFPAFTATVRGNSVIHGLIKVDPKNWPDMDLVARLRSMPPGVSVKINPESLL